jgi:hypothetical protein
MGRGRNGTAIFAIIGSLGRELWKGVEEERFD